MSESRAARRCSRSWITLVVAVGIAVSSSACSGESADDIAARGAAEVQRYEGDPLTAVITEIGVIEETYPMRAHPARKSDDGTQIFGRFGSTPTTFRASYDLRPGADSETVLDEAAAQLEARGYALDRSIEAGRYLSIRAGDDRLTVDLIAFEVGPGAMTISHVVTVTN